MITAAGGQRWGEEAGKGIGIFEEGRIGFCRTACRGKGQQRRELQAAIPTVPKDPNPPTSLPHQPGSRAAGVAGHG